MIRFFITHFISVWLVINYLTSNASAIDRVYYCLPTAENATTLFINLNDTQDTAIIRTRFENESNYRDNIVCQWQIDTNLNYRLQLDSFDIDLQYVPDYSSCSGYDYLDVYDYQNLKQNYILSICRATGFDIILSSENRLFLRFKSNDYVNRRGIELKVKIWNSQTDCPPNWYRSSIGTQETCHFLYNVNAINTLKKSQELCNLAQSNLAYFQSDSQIKDYLSNNKFQTQNVWISLNDINKSNELRWVDGTLLSFDAEILDIENDKNNYCFYMKINTNTYQFIRAPCHSNLFKLAFICTMFQKKPATIYTFPFDRTTENNDDEISTFLVIGLPIIILVVGIVASVGIIFFIKKSKKNLCCITQQPQITTTELTMTDINNGGVSNPNLTLNDSTTPEITKI